MIDYKKQMSNIFIFKLDFEFAGTEKNKFYYCHLDKN